MIDLVKHDSRSLDKINTREAGSRVLTNEQSIGALTSPDSCVPTLLNNYTTLIICEVALQKCLRDGGREKRKSKSPKCNFTTPDGGIGTVDGAARRCDALTMHGPSHASSRRLVRRTPFDSVYAVL